MRSTVGRAGSHQLPGPTTTSTTDTASTQHDHFPPAAGVGRRPSRLGARSAAGIDVPQRVVLEPTKGLTLPYRLLVLAWLAMASTAPLMTRW
jgi:hypothetical protein